MASILHHVVLGGVSAIDRFLLWLKVEGRPNVPEGGAVVVFNHPTDFDPVHVAVALGSPSYFLGKKEAFEWPVVGHILREWGAQIPLDREKGGNLGAIAEAVEHLKRGEKVALAPEGTRTNKGPLGRGRGGAARMAIAAEVPVLPAAVMYGFAGRPRVRFAAPVDLSPWYGRAEEYEAVREATAFYMGRLAAALGEPYDAQAAPDYWAVRRKRA